MASVGADVSRYARAFERSSDAMAVTRLADGVILDVNDSFCALTGYARQEVLGRTSSELDLYSCSDDHDGLLELVLRDGKAVAVDVPLRTRSNEERIAEISADIVEQDGDRFVFVVARDATDRIALSAELTTSLDMLRRSDAARRDLLSRLVGAQEEERRRIALDLHEDPIQKLAAASIRLELLRRGLTDEAHRRKVDEAESIVSLAIHRMRRVMMELRPPTLDSEGLVAAIRETLEDITGDLGITVEVEDRLTREPSPQQRTIAFRVAQEALENVRRHAEASAVRVVVEERDGGLYLAVHDDGVGPDPSTYGGPPAGQFGLAAMRERAELADGWCKLNGDTGRGASMELWLPVHDEPSAWA